MQFDMTGLSVRKFYVESFFMKLQGVACAFLTMPPTSSCRIQWAHGTLKSNGISSTLHNKSLHIFLCFGNRLLQANSEPRIPKSFQECRLYACQWHKSPNNSGNTSPSSPTAFNLNTLRISWRWRLLSLRSPMHLISQAHCVHHEEVRLLMMILMGSRQFQSLEFVF